MFFKIIFFLILFNSINCENEVKRPMVDNISVLIDSSSYYHYCYEGEELTEYSFFLSTITIEINRTGNSTYDVTTITEDSEIYSLYNIKDVEKRARSGIDSVFEHIYYPAFHSCHSDPKTKKCVLYISPFKKSCLRIRSSDDESVFVDIKFYRCIFYIYII